jgi:hypothetical protein
MPPNDRFRYDGFAIDAPASAVECRYSTSTHRFVERFTFPGGNWSDPAVESAVRILYLLAGVSYYKTAAPPRIDLGDLPTTRVERTLLRRFYVEGLGEFAFRNGLDLSGIELTGPDIDAGAPPGYHPVPGRPLIPFGGGIDSIVTVESIASEHPASALCVVAPPGDRFAAIEEPAAVTGLPVTRIGREIDPQVRRSRQLGFLNGHVPVTAVVSAASVVAAVLERRDAVVLSNEWSASAPTLVSGGRAINHQWSKGEEFERDLADLVAAAVGPELSVFSYLRPRSELWVARRFAQMRAYHPVFRSCNRAFHQDPAERLDHWCGECDKCCFIDLVLAPFLSPSELAAIFGDREPLDDAANEARFETLVGLGRADKPFECVGDVGECRSAALLAAARPDRADNRVLVALREGLRGAGAAGGPEAADDAASLLEPLGGHRIPDRYASPDLLARAR